MELLLPELRQVAQALMDSGTTLNQAQDAVAAVQLLKKANIPQADWQRLVNASEKLSEPAFKEGALKLLKLEEDTGKSYEGVVSQFEKLGAEVKKKEEQKQQLNQEIGASSKKKTELNQYVKELELKAKQEKASTDEILKGESLVRTEIEGFIKVKAELKSKGLDVSTFVTMAKEVADSKDLAGEVRRKLRETNSLVKVQAQLRGENEALKVKLYPLKSEVDTLSNKKEGLASAIASLNQEVSAETKLLADLKEHRETKKRQYDFFEALLAMFSGGTPYQDASPQKLASAVLTLAQGWYAGRPVDELRKTFVTSVCGNYLHSIRCKKCYTRFIVDKAQNSYNQYKDDYDCPVCGYALYTESNDDFLKAMFSQEEFDRCKELQQELERLKPLEVFLDIPCSICKKPLSNNWTREQVLTKFEDTAHALCSLLR